MALALYRRYRPDTFDGVIGQDQVTVPLMRALDENKLTHAYLFSGPRAAVKRVPRVFWPVASTAPKVRPRIRAANAPAVVTLPPAAPAPSTWWKSTPPPITVWTMPVNCVNVRIRPGPRSL